MKQFVIFLFALCTPYLAQAQIDIDLANDLQEIVDNRVDVFNNNGISAFVIMPNGLTWNGTAGIDQQGEPISTTTVFNGASTTKLNVALLALLLQEEEVLNLDDAWSDYVTLDVAFNPDITLRQLLNHSSGIADYLETSTSGATVTADFDFFFDPTYILEEVVNQTPDFDAGTDFNYSNSNYVLLGLIIEEVTGNQLHLELRSRIWEPLGMDHTYFGGYEIFTEASAGIWWNFGMGLTNYNDVNTTSILTFAYAAGNIVTTPNDLGILSNELFNNGFLSSASMEQLMTFVPDSYSSWTAGYGLGIHHQFGQTEDLVLGHDGYYTNMTDMFYSETYGFTLVTMTNTQTEWFGIFNPMYNELADYFESTNAINELETQEPVVFPNPSSGLIRLNVKGLNLIEVYDLRGELIHQVIPETGDDSLQLVFQEAGVYLLQVMSKTDSWTERIVITN